MSGYSTKNRLLINYGEDVQKTVYDALKSYGAASLIRQGQKTQIKPNLVNSTPASRGATTHPEVVEGIIVYLAENGHDNIEIIESSWAGGDTDEAFRVCGYERLSKEYGVPCINVLRGKFETVAYKNQKFDVYKDVLGDSFLINVPVLKAHCQTSVTCCIKNLKGLIPAQEKRNFHTWGLHEPIAALGAVINTGLNVVDGICGDLTFEEGGTPVQTNMVIVGEDPLLVDSFVSEFIGYVPEEVKYLSLSKQYGVGRFCSGETEIIELNSENKPKNRARARGIAEQLARYVNEKDACSVCYSSLIHALNKADKSVLRKYEGSKIAIGQGFKGVKREGLGYGSCTSGFSEFIEGCPPKAVDVLKFL